MPGAFRAFAHGWRNTGGRSRRAQRIFQQRDQRAAGDVRLGKRPEHQGHATPQARRRQGGAHLIQHQASLHLELDIGLADAKRPIHQRPATAQTLMDAVVGQQVFRCVQRRRACQVVGRGHGDHRLRCPQRHGDHVTLQGLAQADTGVEACADDVAQAIVQGDIQGDVRVMREKRRHMGFDQRGVGHVGAVDFQRAIRAAGGVVYLLHREANLLQGRGQGVEQLAARLGQRHAACGAVEQAHAQLRFELLDGLGHRRGRDLHLGRRPREVHMTGHAFERDQGWQVGGFQAHAASRRVDANGVAQHR